MIVRIRPYVDTFEEHFCHHPLPYMIKHLEGWKVANLAPERVNSLDDIRGVMAKPVSRKVLEGEVRISNSIEISLCRWVVVFEISDGASEGLPGFCSRDSPELGS